nr:helicase-1 [Pieris rapae granulovirus]
MSIVDILNSYENVLEKKMVSHKYWYFTNGDKIVKRECKDILFLLKLFESTSKTVVHDWTMIPNYYNTKVVPFVPYDDYINLNKNNADLFNFIGLRKNIISEPKHIGDYMVWPGMSANFLGWTLYLYLNENYKLPASIPLYNHKKLGAFNLLTNEDNNLDISCKIIRNNELLFTNTDKTPSIAVFSLQTFDEEPIDVIFGKEYVFVSNTKMWFDYLINNNAAKQCDFAPEYDFICKTILLDELRWLNNTVPLQSLQIEQTTNLDNKMNDILSPCSTFEVEFTKTIDECLTEINDKMLEKSSPSLNIVDILPFYMKNNEYSTFYILLISVWQYCEYTIKMHGQYTIEDILYFVKTLCVKVGGDDKLFMDNLIYFSTKNMAKNFMNSLQFFVTPDQGIAEYFDAVSAYFALHLAIFYKINTWSITPSTIKSADVDINVVSMGFYKKIKVNKFDYIFTGSIYENYKNKKDNFLAYYYRTCPETTVSELLFNKTLNFYMTQEGLFDVCKKIYKEPCPFIVMSTLKKNFISKNQTYIEKPIFHRLFATIDKDLLLFKLYHARKFLDDYYTIINNIIDCHTIGSSMNEVCQELKIKWREMINWVLESKATDILIIMIKLKNNLNQPITNIVSLPVTVDLFGLQVAIVCHLIWPNSKIDHYFWALLSPSFQDFEDWLDDYDFGDLVSNDVFNNKKKITEGMHRLLNRIEYDEKDIFEQVKTVIYQAGSPDKKKYEYSRVVKNIGMYYKKFDKVLKEYNVWSDILIEHRNNESMYTWLTRFYIRMFLNDYSGNIKELINVVKGFSYFRVFTNFHSNNSKALINFCASLAIPIDNEKMCIVLSSKPNCGKSSLWELLSTMILVYKQDKEHYNHNKSDKDEKVKLYESQLYVMNEAQLFSKAYLKSIVDSTKIDSARCNYGVMEKFNSTFKSLICNNDDDKIFVTDGYDKACSNRLGQMYFDHEFDPEIKSFCGSVYEHHLKKRYCEERDIINTLKNSVQSFLANVLMYNCNPNDGQLYYKSILQGDNSYKYNKKCLYIYNTRIEALMYVLNVKECKNAQEFSEEKLLDAIKCAEKYVTQMLNFRKRKNITAEMLCSDFKQKYNSSSRFYNADTKMYSNLQISLDEKFFKQYSPKFKSNVDETV